MLFSHEGIILKPPFIPLCAISASLINSPKERHDYCEHDEGAASVNAVAPNETPVRATTRSPTMSLALMLYWLTAYS